MRKANKLFRRAWVLMALLLGIGLTLLLPAAAKPVHWGAQAAPALSPIVTWATRYDTLPSLKNLPALQARPAPEGVAPPEAPDIPLGRLHDSAKSHGPFTAPYVQRAMGRAGRMPEPLMSFEGVKNLFGGWPPDTNGDIGPNHYVQWINLSLAIWAVDKTAMTVTLALGPIPGNRIFWGMGGPCQETNHGDPIALYDGLRQRWMLSQFAMPNFPGGPYYQCVAVSQTSDPTGGWYRYEFRMPVDKFNDYPKFGVWTDAYYMTVNQFDSGSGSFFSAGAGVAALEKSAMLEGRAARMVYFDLSEVDLMMAGILPADVDGDPPAPGAPGVFAAWTDDDWEMEHYPQDSVLIWHMQVPWESPSQATFGQGGAPDAVIPTANVESELCGGYSNCIPQPGTGVILDSLSDRLMYRLQYRKLNGEEVLLANHTVDADGSDHAGIHWFELRRPLAGGAWRMQQEGVYAPDENHRWMGSAAMDMRGNIALGYSVAGDNTYPSVRYAGRAAGDPPGQLSLAEASLVEGGGSQTGMSRWGDYSSLSVDEDDGCTFWYTQEYVPVTGTNTWSTRIGAFRFPDCFAGPHGVLTGRVTRQGDNAPLEGSRVQARSSQGRSYSRLTGSDGRFEMPVPVGMYTVTATAFGYYGAVLSDRQVLSGTTTTSDFSLAQARRVSVRGTVRDGQGGWPLYAQVLVEGAPIPAVWTDPASGAFTISLPAGEAYRLITSGFDAGYDAAVTTTGPLLQDVQLPINLPRQVDACPAPRYSRQTFTIYTTGFENGPDFTSGGYRSSWAWGAPTSGPAAAASGSKLWGTNLNGPYNPDENSKLYLPALDVSFVPESFYVLSWSEWVDLDPEKDSATLEMSLDDGVTWTEAPTSKRVTGQWFRNFAALRLDPAPARLRLRFHFKSGFSQKHAGWYIDDVMLETITCRPNPGGLVVGVVTDANTGLGLNEAQIISPINPNEWSVLTRPTPLDPHLPDGYYAQFVPGPAVATLRANRNDGYTPVEVSVKPPAGGALRQDFLLTAPRFQQWPQSMSLTLSLGTTASLPLSLSNSGSQLGQVVVQELPLPPVLPGPIEPVIYNAKPFKSTSLIYAGNYLPPLPAAPDWPAHILRQWEANKLTGMYAVGYDHRNETVWVSSANMVYSGEDALFEFTPNGQMTGRWHRYTFPHNWGPGDLAYNLRTGSMWVMNFSLPTPDQGYNCIFEMDPVLGTTGRKICPETERGFKINQRGLAYDPLTDTWFAAGYNDGAVYRFNNQGIILNRINMSIPVHGLAYNPLSRHLFASVSDALQTNRYIYVLDADNLYAILGRITFNDTQGDGDIVGIDMDCDGHLWGINRAEKTTVFELDAGEPGGLCDQIDVPWLKVTPATHTLTPGGSSQAQVTFDASQPGGIYQPGVYRAQLKVASSAPQALPTIPVTLTVPSVSSFGWLRGEVQRASPCGYDLPPMQGGQVKLWNASGLQGQATLDARGVFTHALDAPGSPYMMTIAASGYLTASLGGVTVQAGQVVTAGVTLYDNQACLRVRMPFRTDFGRLQEGQVVTYTVTVSNPSMADALFWWKENDYSQSREGAAASQSTRDMDWAGMMPVSGTLPARSVAYHTLVLTGSQVLTNTSFSTLIGGFALAGANPLYSDVFIIMGKVLPAYRNVQVSAPPGKSAYPGDTVTYTVHFTNTSPATSAFYISNLYDWSNLSASNSASITETQILAPGQGASVVLTSTLALFPAYPLSESKSVMIGSVAGLHDASIRGGWIITTTVLPVSSTLALTYALDGPVWAARPFTVTVNMSNLGPTVHPYASFALRLYGAFELLNPSQACSIQWWSIGEIYCRLGRLEPGEMRSMPIMLRTYYPGPLKGALETVNYYNPIQMLRYPIDWTVNAILTYFPLIRR